MLQLFKPEYRIPEVLEEIKSSLESGWTGDGIKCKLFQEKFADFIGIEASAVKYLNSATAALHLAVKGLNLPKGSLIATTPLTFVSTNAAILYENHVPLFIDVGEYLCIDPMRLQEQIINNKMIQIRAVMWVHHSGSVHPDFLDLVSFLDDRGIPLIEDCAHAMGAFYPGTNKRVGSIPFPNMISCFSFQAVKNLPTADSGMIVTRCPMLQNKISKWSWMGIDKSTYSRTTASNYKWDYSVDELGFKYNPNDIMASIALVQLKYIDHDNAYRERVVGWYKELLRDVQSVRWFEHSEGSAHHLFAIGVNDRQKVMNALSENGHATGVHYVPNYKFNLFKDFYVEGSCIACETFSDGILSLPLHLGVKYSDVQSIAKVLSELEL